MVHLCHSGIVSQKHPLFLVFSKLQGRQLSASEGRALGWPLIQGSIKGHENGSEFVGAVKAMIFFALEYNALC